MAERIRKTKERKAERERARASKPITVLPPLPNSNSNPPPTQTNGESTVEVTSGGVNAVDKIGMETQEIVDEGVSKRTSVESACDAKEESQLEKIHVDKLDVEVKLMMKLDHPNIIRIFQVIDSETVCYIIM